MKKLNLLTILILLFTFLLLSAFGQKEYLKPGKKYSEAKIHKINYKVLRVSSLKLINDSTISFKNKSTKEVELLSVNNVRHLSVKKGNKALNYALIGAGVGTLGVLLAVGSTASDPNREFRDNLGFRIAIIIGGSVAIGAGIGALTSKWKRMFIKNENNYTNFIFYPEIYNNHYSLNFLLNF